MFRPDEYRPVDEIDREKFTEEEIDAAVKELESEDKKVARISVLSVVWTIISTVYAIVSTGFLLARKWVSGTVGYALLGVLILYVGVFIGMVVAMLGNLRASAAQTKGFKTAINIIKPAMNIVLIVFAIIEVVGIAEKQVGVGQLALLVLTLVVAVVQLGLRIWLIIEKIRTKKVAKGYRVSVERYVDGEKKRKNLAAKIKEKHYSD